MKLRALVAGYLLVAAVVEAKTKTTPEAPEAPKCTIRVADYNDVNIIPERYDVFIKTEQKTAGLFGRLVGKQDRNKFKGNVTMKFAAKAAAKDITLHAVNLELLSAEYRQLPKGEWQKMTFQMNDTKQTATFALESGISQGAGEFRCSFKGKIEPGKNEPGVQTMNLTDIKGQPSVGYVSHVIPEGARRIFPCIDFPKYKANFDLTLVVPTNLTALSNMEIISETILDKEYTTIKFAETPKISTFALVFVIGKFHMVNRDIGGLKVRVLVNHRHKDLFGNVAKALDALTKALPALKEYTGLDFAGKKLDIVGIEEPLRTVSTQGVLVMQEDILLSMSRNYTHQDSEIADADVKLKGHITYALAKICFGSDITPEYWDHIWLSEGISTFLSELINGKLYPPQEKWIKYDRSSVRRLGALDTANDSPVKFVFSEPDTVVFSGLVKLATQTKASVFLWMLYKNMQDDLFKKSLKVFVSKHKSGVVKSEDFINAFKEGSGQSMDWFRDILNFRGIVTLHVDCDQNGNSRILTVRQIYYRGGSLPCARNDSVWSFPMLFNTEEGKTYKGFLNATLTNVTVPNIPWKTKWAKINQLNSYFRVLYSENCYQNYGLYQGMGTDKISNQEKRLLRDDLMYLENIYRRAVVRPDNVAAAKITDNYDFTRIRNTLDAHTSPALTTATNSSPASPQTPKPK